MNWVHLDYINHCGKAAKDTLTEPQTVRREDPY